MNKSRAPVSTAQTILLVCLACLLAACATAPTHPTLKAADEAGKLAPLLPVRQFVANRKRAAGFVLSPDGRRLLWSQAVGFDGGIAVSDLDSPGKPGPPDRTYAVGNRGRGGGVTTWLQDSRHFVFSRDPSGNENTQLWVQDSVSVAFAPWAVAPSPRVRHRYRGHSATSPSSFFFYSNERDRSTFDLYEADAASREVREIARNDGTVLAWIIGIDHRLAGRLRQVEPQDGADRVVEWLEPDGSFTRFKTVGGFDTYRIGRVDRSAGKAIVVSNIGRDKMVLLEVDLVTGKETVLARHKLVDVGYMAFAPSGLSPLGYAVNSDYPRFEFLDKAMASDADGAVESALQSKVISAEPIYVQPKSVSNDRRRVILRANSAYDAAELLLDRDTGAVHRLNTNNPNAERWLAVDEPFDFVASDGRRIYGYVTRPRGIAGPVPLVVIIHGGPWTRDSWKPATVNTNQLLVNRGYAVLRVNYRGSAGYGRDYLWAGAGEAYGRMQQDIAEAVQWTIDQDIADPGKIAVLGGSFGGFSVLAQLIQKPHEYQCGVDIVGVADWVRTMQEWPRFWRNRHYFERFYGLIDTPEQRERLRQLSPISHIDQITAPLLVIHGANDVRVMRQDSEDVVAALQELNRPVEYLLFENEGHSISRWRNRLAMWRHIEDFLGDCLGGRNNGFDYYQLVPR